VVYLIKVESLMVL